MLLSTAWAADSSTAASARAESERASAVPKFETFNILLERNIFDPTRRPATSEKPEPVSVTTDTTERIALEGVLINNAQAVAFFEGSDPAYTAAVALGGEIAGHRVIEIRTDGIKLTQTTHTIENTTQALPLEKTTRTLDLPLAAHLSRREKGQWEISYTTGGLTKSSDNKTSQSAAADMPQDEMTRQLMERRRKEMDE